ncbi:MAG TPA: NADH-quinone oxidoreductase subunit I [Candidatus Korarchaeota archaeon]|nr:MAG: NADH-quinone oxidoreductase subunit I [Candidatus Korarchaeota archaeon]HDD68746.1 NADH-quinone oxidoreductase subunit I [Candidatus Korarchaeota archaeon]
MKRGSTPIGRLINHLEAIETGIKYLFIPRMTVKYPEEIMELPEGYRGMIKYKKELCISCSLCAQICPANAMKMYLDESELKKEGGQAKPKRRPGINYTRCIFCGFCVDICPTGALEHVGIHDVAFDSFEAQLFKPKDFEEGPPKVEFERPPKRLRPKMDPKRGIVYEPAD